MAQTYTWSDLLTFIKPVVSSIPTSSLDAQACDRVNRIMWRAAPFRWTLANLTAISLTNEVQDFALTNSDLFRLVRARITRTDTTPDEANTLDIVEWLEPTLNWVQGMYSIRACSMIATTTTVRLDTAVSVPTGVTLQLDGEYQTVPTKITATTTTIVFHDDYIDCAQEGLKWAYMTLAKDPRAGGTTYSSQGQRVYAGQYANFMAALDDMLRSEDFSSGPPQRFPDSSFGQGRGSSANLFGWG